MKINRLSGIFVLISIIEMCVVLAADRALEAQAYSFYDGVSWIRESLFVVFPNSVYVIAIPLMSGRGPLASAIYTVVLFLCVVAPLSYVTGVAVSKVDGKLGHFASLIIYALASFGAYRAISDLTFMWALTAAAGT